MADAVTIDKPQRWDQPFGEDMTAADVDYVLASEQFRDMDSSRFPANLPLREIIANDTRLVSFSDGEIVMREGDYGNSAFVVMEGEVKVVLPPGIPESALGRSAQETVTLFQAIGQLFNRPRYPEVRDHSRYTDGVRADADAEQDYDGVFLKDLEQRFPGLETLTMGPGEMFGEIAALARTPRSATIVASGAARCLEIRWQALRDIRQRIEEFRATVDQRYRERSLMTHLQQFPLLQYLPPEQLEIVRQETVFETYGNFDWYASYKKALAKRDFSKLIDKEPVILNAGDYMDGLLLVRSGFVRVSYMVNDGVKTVSYLGRGSLYGMAELADGLDGDAVPCRYSLRALGYTDLLRIPTRVMEEIVIPSLPDGVLEQYRDPFGSDAHGGDKGLEKIDPTLMDHLMERRFINGTATMMINLDRCIRCDECVTACANGHNNNPRFIRHGVIHDNFMVANACMQCQDPVCMIGCPTGAIHRTLEGVIRINDDTCIGCSTCANSCPYENIQMVPIRDRQGDLVRDSHTHAPILKATKCDLCESQKGGPACQRACPHDALVRMDMRDTAALSNWVNR